jgi:perosamine synthetase
VHIPLAQPDITEKEIKAVLQVLKTPYLSLGPKLPEFERKLAQYAGVRYAVAVNSGTSALHLIIRALGIGAGDEVITTPFSFISSANCILFARGTGLLLSQLHPVRARHRSSSTSIQRHCASIQK